MPPRTDLRARHTASAEQVPFRAAHNAELDLALPLPLLSFGNGDESEIAHVIVRLHGVPLGAVLIELGSPETRRDRLAGAIWSALSGAIAVHLAADGLAPVQSLPAAGYEPMRDPHDCQLRTLPTPAPRVSVVVATYRRPAKAVECIASVLATGYPHLEVIAVDNAPDSGASDFLAAEFAAEPRVRILQEPVTGTSRARNRGIAAATGDIIAITDDDVVVDPWWIGALVRAFAGSAQVGCVTGAVLPRSLASAPQVWFEQLSGFAQSSSARTYRLDEAVAPTRLYPYTSGVFGAGNNMAVRASVLDRIGVFDERLGPGTPTHGAEDLDLLARVVLAGWHLTYEPAALVRHDHRIDDAALAHQLFTYGLGATAMLAKWALRDRRLLLRIVALAARPRPAQSEVVVNTFGGWPEPPDALIRAMRRGMVLGPLAWLKSLARTAMTRPQRPGTTEVTPSREAGLT